MTNKTTKVGEEKKYKVEHKEIKWHESVDVSGLALIGKHTAKVVTRKDNGGEEK